MLVILNLSLGFVVDNKKADPCKQICRQATENVGIVGADGQFSRDDDSLVSVVSMNILAPFYQHLGLVRRNQTELAQEMIRNDRLLRVPCALKQATNSRPDIILLQEVEGGNQPDLLAEATLKELGYNGYVWSSLYPDKAVERNDCVGLAVAFDSNRFAYVRHETFRRGQVVQLIDQRSNRDIVLANLHLNAKPSAIEARLHAVSSCIRRIEAVLTRSESSSATLVVLGGDLNCEHPSVTTRLITAGSVPYGTLRDRNYKAKLTKATAKNLRHSLRFDHVYNGFIDATPVTVSLTGRGPGVMDHLFVCTSTLSGRTSSSRKKIVASGSKRRARRQRALYSASIDVDDREICDDRPMSIKAVLATVGSSEKYEAILKGLPNMAAGFPSDHLPIGVAFSQTPAIPEANKVEILKEPTSNIVRSQKGHSNLSHAATRRRDSFRSSSLVRRRHNLVLHSIAEWLPPGAVRDSSLGHFKVPELKRKTRAPDICCVIGNTLFVMEVTVVEAKNLERAVRTKERKYSDLPIALRTSPTVVDRGLAVSDPLVLAFDAEGKASPTTVTALGLLEHAMQRDAAPSNKLQLEEMLQEIEDIVQGVKIE